MPVVPTPPTTPEVTLSTLSKPCEIQTLHNIDNLQSNTPSLPSQTISIIDTITPSTLCSSTGLINQKSPTPGQQTRLDGGQKPHGAELNSQYPYIMLWSNIDALCWLDVLLCHLCYSGSVRRHIGSISYSSVLKKLITAFEEAQALIAPLQKNMDSFLHSVMELENVAVKRGESTYPLCSFPGKYALLIDLCLIKGVLSRSRVDPLSELFLKGGNSSFIAVIASVFCSKKANTGHSNE